MSEFDDPTSPESIVFVGDVFHEKVTPTEVVSRPIQLNLPAT